MHVTATRIFHPFSHQDNDNCAKKACALLTLLFVSALTFGIFPTVCYFKYRNRKIQPINNPEHEKITRVASKKISEEKPLPPPQKKEDIPKIIEEKPIESADKKTSLLSELSEQEQIDAIESAKQEWDEFKEEDGVGALKKEDICSLILNALKERAAGKDNQALLIPMGFHPKTSQFCDDLCERKIIDSSYIFKSSETGECYILKLSPADEMPNKAIESIEKEYAQVSFPWNDNFITEKGLLARFYEDRAPSKENVRDLQQKLEVVVPAPVITRSSYQRDHGESTMDFNKRILEETIKAYTNGYLDTKVYAGERNNRREEVLNSIIKIDNESMLSETVPFQNLEPLPPPQQIYKTQFSVVTEDTFQVLVKLKREGHRPVGINMANAHRPGGGARDGCTAQEESLCRRSNHLLGLESQKDHYSLKEFGGIYCPHVQVFRDAQFIFLDKPEEIDLVATAAYDLRDGCSERKKLGLPKNGPLNDLASCQNYVEGMETKIRSMLRQMKDHKHLVLGALGCGAFENPPELVSEIFQKVLQSEEFKGRFESVTFAILEMSERDKNNVTAFKKICEELNK